MYRLGVVAVEFGGACWMSRRVKSLRIEGRQTAVDVCGRILGAGNESRTRDLNLGKVALYQLSYSRV